MITQGDCLEHLEGMDSDSVDVIYLDPPFFTQSVQKSTGKDGKKYEFDDSWDSLDLYLKYMHNRLKECYRVLKETGTIFLHCDRIMDFHLRKVLSDVFGENNFRSEIIWSYKRWSNSKKGLLNNHQVIYMYSKSNEYKFNRIYTDYSETTNLDQILQERHRDESGRVQYKRDKFGNVVEGGAKKGVPLSDVWEIPFLNPKAKERTGYPTQKPVELLKRIIEISSDKGDIIMDPFMGSGTTLVAANLMARKYIGIDISKDAVELAEKRLQTMVVTKSQLLKRGKKAYQKKTAEELLLLEQLNAKPVQRNKQIDGIMVSSKGENIAIRIQKKEFLDDDIKILESYVKKHSTYKKGFVIQTNADNTELVPTQSDLVEVLKTLQIQAC